MHIENREFQVDPSAPSSHPATSTGFLSQLKIYSGTFSDKSLLTLFLSPFPLMFSPVVRVHASMSTSVAGARCTEPIPHPRELQAWFAFFTVSIPTVCLGTSFVNFS